MSPVTPNDIFNLEEEDDETTEEEIKNDNTFHEIISGGTNILVIRTCEGCGDTLNTPMVVFTSADSDERDSSILCDEKCA